MATRTPVTTAFTRRKPLVSVAYSVTWTTSSAVRGAVSGAASGLSRSAMTYAIVAAVADRNVWTTTGSRRLCTIRVACAVHSRTSRILGLFPFPWRMERIHEGR